jgi:hypothetical protein
LLLPKTRWKCELCPYALSDDAFFLLLIPGMVHAWMGQKITPLT